MKNITGVLLLTAALVVALFSAGCVSKDPAAARLTLSSAAGKAIGHLRLVRTQDILRRLAARHVARDEFRSELQGFARGILSSDRRYDASDDPRFVLGMEAVRYCRFLLLMPPDVDPVEFFRQDAERELACEQLTKWSKLRAAMEQGGENQNNAIMDIELELALSLNCSREELGSFDYTSLPVPGKKAKRSGKKIAAKPLENAVEILDVTGPAALQLPRPAVEALLDRELELLRELAVEYADTALAELDAASKKGDRKAAAVALCRWRLAMGRLEQLR